MNYSHCLQLIQNIGDCSSSTIYLSNTTKPLLALLLDDTRCPDLIQNKYSYDYNIYSLLWCNTFIILPVTEFYKFVTEKAQISHTLDLALHQNWTWRIMNRLCNIIISKTTHKLLDNLRACFLACTITITLVCNNFMCILNHLPSQLYIIRCSQWRAYS